MKIKILVILIFNLLLLVGGRDPALAMVHTQMNGLFSMDIPESWHWAEDAEDVVIAYPDGKTVAIDIQLVPSRNFSQADIKKFLKEGNDRMIKDGIEAHQGTLIDDQETKIDGVYATRLDFKTSPPGSIYVRYISFFNKGYAFTITYGSADDKMEEVMDDAVASLKF